MYMFEHHLLASHGVFIHLHGVSRGPEVAEVDSWLLI